LDSLSSLNLQCACGSVVNVNHELDLGICSNDNCIHSTEESAYKVVRGVPIMISEKLTDTAFSGFAEESYLLRNNSFLEKVKRTLQFANPQITKKNAEIFIDEVSSISTFKPKVLIIGSGNIGFGADAISLSSNFSIIGTDVYISDTVDVVSDAHYLPFEDNSFDGVWIQAVLEHVVEPNIVISEIHRILKNSGIVYAETPFMQQVHEGAHDFTRFTETGHRFLFKRFKEIKSGTIGGSSMVLSWAFRHYILSITRSNFLSRLAFIIAKLFTSPFIPFESKKMRFDNCSGVFFLGKSSEKIEVTHKQIISKYKGDQ
tara:strand:- start:8325 stop:9272 length:948 start_codon:yes stop_codon:yes gene_type:complete